MIGIRTAGGTFETPTGHLVVPPTSDLATALAATPRAYRIETDRGPFDVQVTLTDHSDGTHVSVTVRYGGADTTRAHIIVDIAIPADDPWWLIPGAFYGENRPADCERLFPRFEIGAHNPDGMVCDTWSFRADRAATPAVFAWGEDIGVALVVNETSPLGLTGIGLRHAAGHAHARAFFPYREEPITYYGSDDPRPASGDGHEFTPGDSVTVELTVHQLSADRHAYAPILRAIYDRQHHQHPIQPWVDAEEAAELTAHGLLTWHYDPDPGVLIETAAFDRGIDGNRLDRQAMHVGWVSGIPWAYALLRHGRRVGRGDYIDAAASVIEFISSNLAPSGTFWGTWYREHGWRGSWTPIPEGLHARTLGEATNFLVRAHRLEASAGIARPAWATAIVSNLEAITNRSRGGNLGAVHDATTGDVLRWRGAAGLAWIPAFIEAAESVDSGDLEASADQAIRWRAVAIEAGEYYSTFVAREFIHGAPEDVDLAPTSEDGYAAVMAYMALWRSTREPRWLDIARRSAEWMLTFRYSYNVDFPAHTLLGTYAFASRGADQASPSNQHLHNYGLICTRELKELSDALDDPHFAERAEETFACFRQFIAREDGDFNAYRGMVSERYYQTECFQPKGMLLTLSHAWCVGAVLLAAEETLTPSLAP